MNRLFLALILALVASLGLGTVGQAIPAAHAQNSSPTLAMPATVAVGGTATLSGQNFTPSSWVYLYYQRPDGTTSAVYVQTNAAGEFIFTLGFTAAHGTGVEYLSAYDFGTGRWSPRVSIQVTANVPVPMRLLQVSATSVIPEALIAVSGQGFGANNWVYVYFQRPNGTAGAYWTRSGSTGVFSSTLAFTAANGCGTEIIWAYDYATRQWSAPRTVTVTGCGSLAAPSNLQVVSVTRQQTAAEETVVMLRWQDNNATETGFRIRATFTRLYGGSDEQQWDVAGNAVTRSVNFVAGGINPVKTACFTVSALSGTAESAPSNQVCVQVQA